MFESILDKGGVVSLVGMALIGIGAVAMPPLLDRVGEDGREAVTLVCDAAIMLGIVLLDHAAGGAF